MEALRRRLARTRQGGLAEGGVWRALFEPYYGNATIRTNVVMFPRPVPGSQKVLALFTAHHGQTHGAVGLIDVPMTGVRQLRLVVTDAADNYDNDVANWANSQLRKAKD